MLGTETGHKITDASESTSVELQDIYTKETRQTSLDHDFPRLVIQSDHSH